MNGLRLSLSLVLLLNSASAWCEEAAHATAAGTPPLALNCRGDLDFTADYLLANDAGIQGAGWKTYPASVLAVLDKERQAAKDVQSPSACEALIERFMASIRSGHLWARAKSSLTPPQESSQSTPKPEGVTTQRLSARTSLITVPAFWEEDRQQLLKAIEKNHDGVRDAENLILDLRKNGGGFDSAFDPLLRLLGPATYHYEQPDIFASPANVSAWQAIRPHLPNQETVKWVDALIERMKSSPGGWVPMADKPVVVHKIDTSEALGNPKRVVILIDRDCASSGEQFVLTARQNPRVTLMGRNTHGALDASNVRMVMSPSGQIEISYATTFIRRQQGKQVDMIGIPPDVRLPASDNAAAWAQEVDLALKYLEGTSARPQP
ncbi:S41 family peptidase [Roseateles sp. BYS180W]|uniref:S41 family peptidase n=1 Tax=Roseateles rivi TaxID=3299028 RepID=A0ABW7FX43_9BURK